MPQEQNLEGFTIQYHWSKSKSIVTTTFATFAVTVLGTMLAGVSHMLGSFISIIIDPNNFNQWPPVGASSWFIVGGYAAIILLIANIVRFVQKRYTGASDVVVFVGLILMPFLFAAIFQ